MGFPRAFFQWQRRVVPLVNQSLSITLCSLSLLHSYTSASRRRASWWFYLNKFVCKVHFRRVGKDGMNRGLTIWCQIGCQKWSNIWLETLLVGERRREYQSLTPSFIVRDKFCDPSMRLQHLLRQFGLITPTTDHTHNYHVRHSRPADKMSVKNKRS